MMPGFQTSFLAVTDHFNLTSTYKY